MRIRPVMFNCSFVLLGNCTATDVSTACIQLLRKRNAIKPEVGIVS